MSLFWIGCQKMNKDSMVTISGNVIWGVLIVLIIAFAAMVILWNNGFKDTVAFSGFLGVFTFCAVFLVGIFWLKEKKKEGET